MAQKALVSGSVTRYDYVALGDSYSSGEGRSADHLLTGVGQIGMASYTRNQIQASRGIRRRGNLPPKALHLIPTG